MLVSVQSWTATPLWSPAASATDAQPHGWLTSERHAEDDDRQSVAGGQLAWLSTGKSSSRSGPRSRDAYRTPGSFTTAARQTSSCSTTKQLFSVSDELFCKAKTTSLPPNIPIADLPQHFCDFFVTKIKRIRDPPSFFKFVAPQLSMFEPVTEELICRLISQSPTKSCTLDPIPTTLTKQFSLHIAASHMAHVLVYYTFLVVIIIIICIVKLRKCWRML